MDIGPWPRVSNAALHNSLRTAEGLADVARQVTDPPLHRLLLAASCRILDGTLAAAEHRAHNTGPVTTSTTDRRTA
jgi:hypothetical protein